MYFKFSGRVNPETDQSDRYLRLVESYRNAEGRVCHRTILNIGFPKEEVSIDQLNQISRQLTARYEHKLDLFSHEDDLVNRWCCDLWQRIVDEKRLDLTLFAPDSRKIDADTMQHNNVREIGTEQMCYRIFKELNIDKVLAENGFDEDTIRLSQTQIISRAVYPASELATTRWIQENSAICELTGYPLERINKDKLYRNALKLYGIKDVLEQHLSVRTNELFDIQDRVFLYDLTNTYFEGEKRNSKLAQYGRSKEKRNDAKLVVLAMVVNMYGFIKHSAIHEGNFADTSDISTILEGLQHNSGTHPSLVVIDAGIATQDNLNTISSKGYHYLCVSRSKPKDYRYNSQMPGTIYHHNTSNPGKQLILRKIATQQGEDYLLEVNSKDKQLKEAGIKNRFEQRLEEEFMKIEAALHRKGGVKSVERVNRRIGRAAEKYPSIYKYYNIHLTHSLDSKTVTSMQWEQDPEKAKQKNEGLGRYILRTDLDFNNEIWVWEAYNLIREIENTFRTLKTDLDLRPIYHKRDDSTMAHLHLGILGYWLVNTIRQKLKQQGINHNWSEIVRIGNTQKIITTVGYNTAGNEVTVRKCSRPTEKLKQLYHILKLPLRPFTKRTFEKSVVHKRQLKNIQIAEIIIPPG